MPALPPRGAARPAASVVVPTALASGVVAGAERVFLEGLLVGLLPTLTDLDEVVVVLDPSSPDDRAASFRASAGRLPGVQVVDATGPFSFSDRVNTGVLHSTNPVVVLLNDDTEIIEPDWLDRMSAVASASGVGAAGATLLYEDGSVQHAGLTTIQHMPTHAWYGWSPEDPVADLTIDRPAWALTGACLATTRAHWDQVGGFSEEFPINYNDVDFCLKLSQAGLANVILGSVVLRHFETRTRPRTLDDDEVLALQRRWLHRLGPDPLVPHHDALQDRSMDGNRDDG